MDGGPLLLLQYPTKLSLLNNQPIIYLTPATNQTTINLTSPGTPHLVM